MRDNPQSLTAAGERLDNLRKYDEAWRTLGWSNDVWWSTPSAELVRSEQGVFLALKDGAQLDMGMDIRQLPSRTRNVPHQFWTIKPLIERGNEEDEEGTREEEVYEVCRSPRI